MGQISLVWRLGVGGRMGRETDFSPRALPHPSRSRAAWVTGHALYLEESKVTLKETVLLISGLLALSRFCVLPLHPSDFFLTVPLKKQTKKNHLPLTRSLEHTVGLWNIQSSFSPALEVACPGMDPKLSTFPKTEWLKSMH